MKTLLAISEARCYTEGVATVTETLRKAMERSGQSRYVISKATGIPQSGLSRFAAGHTMRGDSIDVLARYLGLELRPASGRRKAVK